MSGMCKKSFQSLSFKQVILFSLLQLYSKVLRLYSQSHVVGFFFSFIILVSLIIHTNNKYYNMVFYQYYNNNNTSYKAIKIEFVYDYITL